jgi:hypothetical protein
LRERGSRTWGAVSLALALAALAPATSRASITVGSDLTLPTSGSTDNCILSMPPCTHLLVAVHSGNQFPLKSPTKGIVKSFGIKIGGSTRVGETVTFRLGQLSGSSQPPAVTGAGTGPTATFNGAGIHSVPANLAVKVGDQVGIDTSSTSATAALNTCGIGSGFFTLHPTITDFGSPQSIDSNSICELLVNAVIQPTSVFGFNPKQTYTVKKDKIILYVELPGPGGIKVSGKGATGVRTAPGAGTVKLPIKLSGRTISRLDANGKATVKVKVTFTPVGGDAGTETRKLKLKAG